jgi:hypothetical protein
MAPTPFITAVFAPMMTPTIFSALLAPDPTTLLLANLVTAMCVAPRLVILGPVALPNLCFRLRSPSHQRQ